MSSSLGAEGGLYKRQRPNVPEDSTPVGLLGLGRFCRHAPFRSTDSAAAQMAQKLDAQDSLFGMDVDMQDQRSETLLLS